MFKEDGKVIHFAVPRGTLYYFFCKRSSCSAKYAFSTVQAAVNANTFAIHGRSVEKELTELGNVRCGIYICTRLLDN